MEIFNINLFNDSVRSYCCHIKGEKPHQDKLRITVSAICMFTIVNESNK